MGKIEQNIEKLGISLPPITMPVASYVPFVVTGGMAFISGQLPMEQGKLRYTGKLGKDFTVEDGQMAARMCALNLLAQIKAACGNDLDRVARCVKLGVFVNADAGFTESHLVANGASNLIVEVFGDLGKHTRTTICVSELPLGAAVEVDAVFAVK